MAGRLVAFNASLTSNDGSSVLSVLLGNGDGTFQTAVPYPAGGTVSSVAVADVNGDGKPDLLVSEMTCNPLFSICYDAYAKLGVLLGHGDGTFQAAVTYTASASATVTVAAMGTVWSVCW